MTVTYSPSTIVPADWRLGVYFYIGGSPWVAKAYGEEQANGGRVQVGAPLDATFHANGGCAICGAHYDHGVAMAHRTEPVLIAIGQVCGQKYFGTATHGNVMRDRGDDLERRAETAAKADAFLAERPELARDLEEADHYIVSDIGSKLRRYGDLSDAQVELVHKIAREQREYEARRREREAALADAGPIEEGRHEVTGTVISDRWDTVDFGGYSPAYVHKMLVELDDGNRLWGTVPAAIDTDDIAGSRVRLTATVERSGDDEHFGFYKRPTKAEVLGSPSEKEEK